MTKKGGPVKISNSRVKLWRRCRRAHYYRYVEGIEKKRPAVALVRGKIIHEMIEARINRKPWKPILDSFTKEFNKLFKEEKELYGNLPDEVYRMMKGYEKTWGEDGLEYIRLGGKRAEFEFEVPLIPGAVFHGLIDTVPRDDKGRVWIMEHKTHKTMPSEENRFTDLQTVLYTWVAPQIGFPNPNGVLWDYIRTKTPTKPELLANGKALSKRKDIDTTYDVYLETILEHGFDPSDYEDILDRLRGNAHKFYRRIYLPAPRNIMDQIIADLAETAREIITLQEISKSRNITKDCSWCSYYSLCQAELRGLDAGFIRKSEYKPRDERGGDKNGKEEDSE